MNTGHGHVNKRDDGQIARCGGPGLCTECSLDQVQKDKTTIQMNNESKEIFKDEYPYILDIRPYLKRIDTLEKERDELEAKLKQVPPDTMRMNNDDPVICPDCKEWTTREENCCGALVSEEEE